MEPAIRIENLGKSYQIGKRLDHNQTFQEQLKDLVVGPFQRLGRALKGESLSQTEEFWALRGVSFDVQPGEVVGIIGRNGAGKSTLLKILSRITEPTTGQVTIKGRVASLLEVGTGFHPELTGRENIYLNGSILGMAKAEIDLKFDEIVEFSGIQKFLDTPVKRYSSGMYVRLAFSVAAHLDPEILVVDEVLAVGDAAFQKRCLGRMGEVAKEGRTVLFVSHHMAAVSNLCSRGIILDNGSLAQSGPVTEVVSSYINSSFRENLNHSDIGNYRPSWACCWITSLRILDIDRKQRNSFAVGEDITIELKFQSPSTEALMNPGMGVVVNHSVLGAVGGINTMMTGVPDGFSGPLCGGAILCTIRSLPIIQGNYTVDVWLSEGPTDIDCVEGYLDFSIESTDVYGTGRTPYEHTGVVLMQADWNLLRTK